MDFDMDFDFDAFEKQLLSLIKLSDKERTKRWLELCDLYDDADQLVFGPAPTLEAGAYEVYHHLAIGDLEDAHFECCQRFQLNAQPGSGEDNRLRAILERICNLVMQKEPI